MGTLDPSERSESFQPGQTFGKFYLVQAIGEGGTSRIYKALQQPISRLVALKIPSFPAGGGVLTPDEFLSEATLMARLDHAGIVRIHDFGVEEGRAFICMEYVEGWNLQELVERFHPLPASAVLAIALQVLEALLHAHARGVLHQDLSPANVLISRAGSAKLADFGMAGKGASAPGGNVVGTPAVLSPEHVAGEPCTARSDLFSFGSLLYFMARGEPLFNPGEGNCRLMEAFREIEKARWQPPLDRLRALPASLSRLVRSAFEGGDPEAMLRDMRDLWAQSEGSTTPEEALRREVARGLEGASAAGKVPASAREVRDAYQRLRAEGRHREAVDLLERALLRFPDHPLLRELLTTPPARVKSAAVTMEVAVPAADDHAETTPVARRPHLFRAALLVPALALVAGGAALFTLRAQRADSLSHKPPSAAAPAALAEVGAVGSPAAPEASRPEAPRMDSPAPEPGSAPVATATPVAPAPRTHAAAGSLVTRVSASLPTAAPRRMASLAPALRVAGPEGTRILVNDSLELEAPSPLEGWALPAGLLKLVVTHPDLAQPISSSLFAAADTLYILDLQADGGFSVSRRRR